MINSDRTLLKEAFVDPIRFALLLDDQFPRYQDAVSGKSLEEMTEVSRAKDLQSMCRHHGWLCDIDNGSEFAATIEETKHLHQSDLLVLDYHLDPTRSEDPSKAIRILQRLAESPHFNLVVIYTSAPRASVTRDVAYCLGAGTGFPESYLELWEDEDPKPFSDELSEEMVDLYLNKEKIGESANPLRKKLRDELGMKMANPDYAISALIDHNFRRSISAENIAARSTNFDVLFCAAIEVPWVQAGNVFVAVVEKSEAPSALVDRLTDALCSWNPTPLRTFMAYARATLEKAGSIAETAAIGSARRQAGVLMHILTAHNEHQKRRRLTDLYSRISADLASTMDGKIAEFGDRLISAPTETSKVEHARIACRVHKKTSDGSIYHALNEYLCMESTIDDHITTGTLFHTTVEGKTDYWLCLAPACEVVPGQNDKGFDKTVLPIRPITAARLKTFSSSRVIEQALQSATHGRHVFWSANDQPIVLEVTDDATRQLDLHILFMEDQGRVAGGKVRGHALTRQNGELPALAAREYIVVGRLRTEYANRLLAIAGQQKGRIGVDFENAPAPISAPAASTDVDLATFETVEGRLIEDTLAADLSDPANSQL